MTFAHGSMVSVAAASIVNPKVTTCGLSAAFQTASAVKASPPCFVPGPAAAAHSFTGAASFVVIVAASSPNGGDGGGVVEDGEEDDSQWTSAKSETEPMTTARTLLMGRISRLLLLPSG